MVQPRKIQLDVKLGPALRRPPDVLKCLVGNLYEVLDRRWQTYCVFVSSVVTATLTRLGMDAEMVPCQLIFLAEQRMDMVGFTGHCGPGQWDGHVAVRIGRHLIDGALASLYRFGEVDVPPGLAVPCLPVASNILARHALGDGGRLLWLAPPAGAATEPPAEPADLVADMAERLAERVRACCGKPAWAGS
ncbi:MAG: hypothetical protein ACM31L_01405 [Actinomycetota bacterium]